MFSTLQMLRKRGNANEKRHNHILYDHPFRKQMAWKFTVTIRLVNYISLAVKPKNVIANTAGSARFHFMFVAEQPLSCHSSSVVQFSMGKYSK